MKQNEGWSFCIVTAPGNEVNLRQCINKIYDEFENVDNYEIVIVGNPDLDKKALKKVILVPFKEEIFGLNFTKNVFLNFLKTGSFKSFFYKTGAICHKKNLAAKNAKYDKLCIMHDYVGLENGWRIGYEEFGNDWEVCMSIVLNQNNSRHRDWMAWDHPEICNDSKGSGACLIPYDKYTKYMYFSGTYFYLNYCKKILTVFFLFLATMASSHHISSLELKTYILVYKIYCFVG